MDSQIETLTKVDGGSMALGPGKYDDLANYCMGKTRAKAVVVVVFEGDRGSGISGKESVDFEIALHGSQLRKKLPAVLRACAREIENAPPDAFPAPTAPSGPSNEGGNEPVA